MKNSLKPIFALLLLTCVFAENVVPVIPAATTKTDANAAVAATTPVKPADAAPATTATPSTPATSPAPDATAKPAEKASALALLNSQKENLTDADFGDMFQQDITSLGGASTLMDDTCAVKLDSALKSAAADSNALSFIFTQATEGRLCSMLGQNQADIDTAMKSFKDSENFTPVTNNGAKGAPAPAANNNNNVNSGDVANANKNVDAATVAAQQAAQADQMKAAQNAINSLFAQADNKISKNASMPNIAFGGPSTAVNADAKVNTGAGLARVAVTPAASK